MEEKLLVFKDENGLTHDYNHIVALIRFSDDDGYQLTTVTINEKYVIRILPSQKVKTQYRTQGNFHILFSSEMGPYFYKGFDGHKGNVFFDSNEIMTKLVDYINEAKLGAKFDFDYELLGVIEKYFKDSQI